MNLLFDEALADSTRTTPEFVLTKSPRPVEAIADLKPAAASLGAKIELVDSVRGTALPGAREIANFMLERGSTAAARRVVVRFPEVPAGNYYLAITPTGINAARDQPLSVVVKITREKAGWGIFVLGLMALAAWPLIANWRHGAFETRRWMESGVTPDSPGLLGFFTDDSAYSQAANRNGRSA
jgi:hypothetical protein